MAISNKEIIPKYSWWRRLSDEAQFIATFSGWPQRLAGRLGNAQSVALDHHEVRVGSSLGHAASLRIAFASDFHAGPTTSHAVIQHAIVQLHEAQADVLLLGGDFVSLRAHYARELVSQLAGVPAPFGRYAVLGNHDHWAGAPAVTDHLQRVGIDVLTNRNVRLPDPYRNVSICGIDDHSSGEPDAAAAFDGSGPVRVVLMHAPSGMLDIGDRAFAVAFSGHTHGGQIALPGGRPLIVAQGRLSRRYNAGRFEVDNGRTLFVSRGIGCSTVPFRWNAAPHVLTCTLQAH